MKTNNAVLNKNRVLGDMDDSIKFTLKAGPELMRILSTSLYTDKEGAVVRELICNARDAWFAVPAHKRHPHAFDINVSREAYTIRDYGTGLSHENIIKLMTTYGESTKSGENNSIGGWGVGSKSPFAYTQEFTLVSYYDSFQRTYHAILADNGVPELKVLGDAIPTTEKNGIMFRVPLKSPSDIYTFKNKAVSLCETIGCPSRLKVQESDRSEWVLREGDFSDRLARPTDDRVSIPSAPLGWQYVDIDNHTIRWAVNNSNEANAIYIGGVPYEYEPATHRGDPIWTFVIAEFPIGSLDISVSRERLDQTSKNKDLVDKVTAHIKKTCGKVIQDRLNATKSLFEKYHICRNNNVALFGIDDLARNSSYRVQITKPLQFQAPPDPLMNAVPHKACWNLTIDFRYILKDTPRDISKRQQRVVFNGWSDERREGHCLNDYSTRQEWLDSPLGDEIRYSESVIENGYYYSPKKMFIWQSDIVVPKAERTGIKVAPKEHIRVQPMVIGASDVRLEQGFIPIDPAKLPINSFFWIAENAGAVTIPGTYNQIFSMSVETWPNHMLHNMYVVNKANYDKLPATNNKTIKQAYAEWLCKLVTDPAKLHAYASKYNAERMIKELVGRQAYDYINTNVIVPTLKIESIRVKLEADLKNMLTIAKNFGIIDTVFEQNAKDAVNLRIADAKSKLPAFDPSHFIKLVNQ